MTCDVSWIKEYIILCGLFSPVFSHRSLSLVSFSSMAHWMLASHVIASLYNNMHWMNTSTQVQTCSQNFVQLVILSWLCRYTWMPALFKSSRFSTKVVHLHVGAAWEMVHACEEECHWVYCMITRSSRWNAAETVKYQQNIKSFKVVVLHKKH